MGVVRGNNESSGHCQKMKWRSEAAPPHDPDWRLANIGRSISRTSNSCRRVDMHISGDINDSVMNLCNCITRAQSAYVNVTTFGWKVNSITRRWNNNFDETSATWSSQCGSIIKKRLTHILFGLWLNCQVNWLLTRPWLMDGGSFPLLHALASSN